MPGILLILALQAATATLAPSTPVPAPMADAPRKFSILVPVANEPCVRQPADSDATVCADALPSQKLPYTPDVVPNGPQPSNPFRTGSGALAVEGTPCAVSSRGCIVGFGPPIMPIIKGAAGLVKSALAKKPDKTGRVAIDDSAPAGRIEP